MGESVDKTAISVAFHKPSLNRKVTSHAGEQGKNMEVILFKYDQNLFFGLYEKHSDRKPTLQITLISTISSVEHVGVCIMVFGCFSTTKKMQSNA